VAKNALETPETAFPQGDSGPQGDAGRKTELKPVRGGKLSRVPQTPPEPHLLYLVGEPEAVFQAVWRGLEGLAARERIAEGVTLTRTTEGEASLEIPMASREEGQGWLRRLANVPGVAVLLTDANGDEVLGRS
jgi:hypothetical protein